MASRKQGVSCKAIVELMNTSLNFFLNPYSERRYLPWILLMRPKFLSLLPAINYYTAIIVLMSLAHIYW